MAPLIVFHRQPDRMGGHPHLQAVAPVGRINRGPLEVEILRERESGDLYVLEINPRFPAWIYLSAGAGQNLPLAAVRLALGERVSRPLPPYRIGTMFVRISLDQITDLGTYEALTSHGMTGDAGGRQ